MASDGGVDVGVGAGAAVKFPVAHSTPSLDQIRVVGGVVAASVNLVSRALAPTSFI